MAGWRELAVDRSPERDLGSSLHSQLLVQLHHRSSWRLEDETARLLELPLGRRFAGAAGGPLDGWLGWRFPGVLVELLERELEGRGDR